MSNAIFSFSTLHNNPFIYAPLFHPFYEALGEKQYNLLLSYLILPLVLFQKSRKFLVQAKSTSSLHTMTKKRELLYGIDDRIDDYRELTNTSVQYALDMGVITISNNLSVVAKSNWSDDSICPTDTPKAASQLGRLLAPYEIPYIYRKFGVRRL